MTPQISPGAVALGSAISASLAGTASRGRGSRTHDVMANAVTAATQLPGPGLVLDPPRAKSEHADAPHRAARGAKEGHRRYAGLDIVRVFAALIVIWHHAVRAPELTFHDSMWHGTWGTSFFNFMAGFLLVGMVRRRPGEGFDRFAVERFKRLYIPFLIWSCIGLLARVPNELLFGNHSSTTLSIHMLWHGATYHLWFLPYVLLASLLSYLPLRYVLDRFNRNAMVTVAIVLAATGIVALAYFTPVALRMQQGTEGGWSVAGGHLVRRYPLFLVGISFGLLILAVPAVLAWVRRLFPLWFGTAMVAITMRQVFGLYPSVTVRVGAISAFLLGLGMDRFQEPPLLARLGRCSFGVYLCHFLFVEGGISIARAAGFTPAWWVDLGIFTFAAVGAFTLAIVLRRNRITAWLIP